MVFKHQAKMNFQKLYVWSLCLSLMLPATRVFARSISAQSAAGITVRMDEASGHYEIKARRPGWKFAGDLGQPARDIVVEKGKDRIGAYQEIRFNWRTNITLTGSIRVYDSRPAALFTGKWAQDVDELPATFPRFTSVPAGLQHFSYQNQVFAPPSFKLEPNGTPWLFFDDRAEAMIISPADNFLIARMSGNGTNDIASSLNPQVRHLPASFQHATLMAFGDGINPTWAIWGAAFTDWVGRHRPANDADLGLRYLGYWTDNGAVYYYHYDPALGYTGTLEALVHHYREQHIPIRYLQLDSWWYDKSLTDPDGDPGQTKNPKLPAG